MSLSHKIASIGLLFFLLYTSLVVMESCDQAAQQKHAAAGESALVKEAFVGSSACQSCHAKEFADWRKSDHFLAMQVPHDSTVLGDFNNATLNADGITSKFFKRNGKFYINTQGDDGLNHDFEVIYTFGYFPLQQYLIAFPGGRLQSTRVSWDSRDKKWFHQYPGQKIHHKDWLHWTGSSQNWNTMCASCHSTNLQKNYDYVSDAFNTTWNEINVACESCHGPGGRHLDFMKTSAYKKGERLKNNGFLYGNEKSPRLQVNTCAPCHARKTDLSKDLIHSDELLDDMIPQIINDEFYFADGQIKEEDYEYSSFTQSKMFHKGVQCSNCHNPHSGKLLALDNQVCMSCHQPKYNTKEHHFHALNTEGAKCVNCHMQQRTYMGNDHRRDHSFRVPRPDQSVVYNTPNTCTSCHKQKTASWAANAINKWYGPKRQYHFSDDLLPGSLLNDRSEKHLVKLLKDTLQPEIVRATAVFYLSNIQTAGSAQALIDVLHDRKALVRYHGLRALENFSPEVWQQVAYLRLSDPVRAVRIAAADLYHRLPAASIPTTYKSAYRLADEENKKYLQYQTDFAAGNVMLADYQLQGGEHLHAIENYIRGLKKDSLMNYARFNLASTYNIIGKNQEALQVLKDAAALDPDNDRVYYNLGLLHYEMGQLKDALVSFQKGVDLKSQNPSLYYNYGLLLQQLGKVKESEQVLLKGYALDPMAANINYALGYYYINQNLPDRARKHVTVLKHIDPENSEYLPLFKALDL